MITPFATMLETLGRRMSAALVPPSALARIAAVTQRLPTCSSQISLECRLRSEAPQVDFLFPLIAETGEHHTLATHLASHRPEGGSLADRSWRNTGDLFAEWVRPGSFLQAKLPFVWLEFDLPETAGPPAPFTYACLQPDFLRSRFLGSEAGEDGNIPHQLATETLRLLHGESLRPEVSRCIQGCFDALPASAYMMHVASLACRGMDAIRLVAFMPRRELSRYLSRIGWPGQLDRVEALVESLSGITDFVDLDLDAGATIHPRIGMTLPLFWSAGTPRWRRLLKLLESPEVCAPDKLEAFQRWLGQDQVLLPGHRWPTLQLQNAAVKLVLPPGAPLEAKLYPNLQYQFSLAVSSGKKGRTSSKERSDERERAHLF